MSRAASSTLRDDRRLIAAAPLRTLRDEWAAEIELRAFRNPASGELAVMRSCLQQLDERLRAAHKTETWATVEDAFAATGVPPSTITRWCRKYSERCGATQPGGQKEWAIDLRRFVPFAEEMQRTKRCPSPAPVDDEAPPSTAPATPHPKKAA